MASKIYPYRNMSSRIVARPYFDATPESSDDELLAELPGHPVLALRARGRSGV
jgi:hypothetical protein